MVACGREGAPAMVSRVTTVAFQGIEAVPVDVQVMVPFVRTLGQAERVAGEGHLVSPAPARQSRWTR